MDADEYLDWTFFAEKEPIGAARADLRTAVLCHVLSALHTPKGKEPQGIAHFLAPFRFWPEDEPSVEQQRESIRRAMMKFADEHNAALRAKKAAEEKRAAKAAHVRVSSSRRQQKRAVKP